MRETMADALASIHHYEELEAKFTAIPSLPAERDIYSNVATEWNSFKVVGARALEPAKINYPTSQDKLREIFLRGCPESAAKFATAMVGQSLCAPTAAPYNSCSVS